MKKLRHTPGPWSLDDINTTMIVIEKSNPYEYIAESDPVASVRQEEEVIANARLISAAPEMLETLITIYKNPYSNNHDKDLVKPILEKATGMSIDEVLSE